MSPPGSTAAAPLFDERVRRERARSRGGVAITGLLVLFVVAVLLWAHVVTAPSTPSPPAEGTATADAASGPPPPGGWDPSAEAALAAAPMPALPESAAQPQTLGTRSAGPPVEVPPGRSVGTLVDEGFPDTPEGAIGQLAALDVVALRDLDPRRYAAAYRSIALPLAPDPLSTPTGSVLAELWGRSGGDETGPMTARWQLAGASVKGVVDRGRQVVVCVLGELQAAKAETVTVGAGDCQSLRWTGAQWRVAPGPAPAKAPDAWPGSDDFARAGYRPVLGGSS